MNISNNENLQNMFTYKNNLDRDYDDEIKHILCFSL